MIDTESSPVIHKDVLEYMDNYWKPNQDDSYIVVENTSDRFQELKNWFENYQDFEINVGPFVKIKPYAMVPDFDNPEERTEFIFIYDEIDNSKLSQKHLTIR